MIALWVHRHNQEGSCDVLAKYKQPKPLSSSVVVKEYQLLLHVISLPPRLELEYAFQMWLFPWFAISSMYNNILVLYYSICTTH